MITLERSQKSRPRSFSRVRGCSGMIVLKWHAGWHPQLRGGGGVNSPCLRGVETERRRAGRVRAVPGVPTKREPASVAPLSIFVMEPAWGGSKNNPNRLAWLLVGVGMGVKDRAISEPGNDHWVPFIPLASPEIPTSLLTRRFYNTWRTPECRSRGRERIKGEAHIGFTGSAGHAPPRFSRFRMLRTSQPPGAFQPSRPFVHRNGRDNTMAGWGDWGAWLEISQAAFWNTWRSRSMLLL